MERVTKLLMFLLSSSRSMTRDEILERSELYGPSNESERKKFRRDRETLESAGIEIRTEIGLGEQAGSTLYTILEEDYFLPDLGLSVKEQLALEVAASMVQLDTAWDEQALIKIADGEPLPPSPAVAQLAPSAGIEKLYEAVRSRAKVYFDYRGVSREVEPYGLLHRGGNWYLHGSDSEERKNFKVIRIQGEVKLGEKGGFLAPADFDAANAMSSDPLLIGDETEILATVKVDAFMAKRVARTRGRIVKTNPDGSILLEVPVRNPMAFRSWLLGLRDHAVVVEPKEILEDTIQWLTEIKGQ